MIWGLQKTERVEIEFISFTVSIDFERRKNRNWKLNELFDINWRLIAHQLSYQHMQMKLQNLNAFKVLFRS